MPNVTESVDVDVPVARAYTQWTQFEWTQFESWRGDVSANG